MAYEERLREEQLKDLQDKRDAGLAEIHAFYAKQHTMLGKKPTFIEIQHNNTTINLGEYMKFCKDFNIKISKSKCTEVFKKTAVNSIEMQLPHFVNSFGKLF